jgi:hypothetical protein
LCWFLEAARFAPEGTANAEQAREDCAEVEVNRIPMVICFRRLLRLNTWILGLVWV